MFCERKRTLKLEKRGEMATPLFPSFALAPTLRLLFLLSLIFFRHNKDGGYNSTNINRQLSPAQNTPALQATLNKTRIRRAWKEFWLVCFLFLFSRFQGLFLLELISCWVHLSKG